jgi:hypothetical protein
MFRVCALAAAILVPGMAQQNGPPQAGPAPTVQALVDRLAAAEARIRELEQRMATPGAAVTLPPPARPANTALVAEAVSADANTPVDARAPAVPEVVKESLVANPEPDDAMAHMMEIPGGPKLQIRGFFDFNFGVGSIANPLVYPISDGGCGICGNPIVQPHTAFQAGEFDLFMTSKISEHLSFLAEVVMGPSDTNLFGLDIERYQLTYKKNAWFSASLGRFHTSIGYYNTAYHHGNWFATAEGRPIMYLFEDSGGILPVHMVGASFTGEVPHTESIHLNWVAEVGNGNTSTLPQVEAVQNFVSDRNYKATNFAAYIRPEFLSGLQIGGSWYHDGLNPSQGVPALPIGEVRQNVESAYVVYLTSKWEFMNEAVLMSNHIAATSDPFRSRMGYTQVARKFGIYQPYFRYQYVNDAVNDPVNLLAGKYYGPSIGMRIDIFAYAALKLQFNHLYQSSQLPGNGFNTQLAFAF